MNESTQGWDELPTETEIYILPSGEIVVADLPAELAATLGRASGTGLHDSTPDAAHADKEMPTGCHAE